MMKKFLCVLLILISGCRNKWWQRQADHELSSPATQTTTQPATQLEAGLGNHYHPTSTKNPHAQRFFDQGLTLCYAFNHEAAIGSFKRAYELDPNFAMAHWGVALALGPNYNMPVTPEAELAAYDEVQKAITLSKSAPQHERDYIAAVSKRYSNDPKADLAKLSEDYASAMRDLRKKYPDDTDAATLFAEAMMDLRPWKLWTPDGKPAPGTLEIVAVLEDVLRREPDHIGANHLYIHAVEASPHPEWALECAGRLPGLAPGAGHLVHMPSHVYSRVGEYDASAGSNEQAVIADKVYMQNHPEAGLYTMMYYSHNLHFAAVAHAMQGRYGDARYNAIELAKHVDPHLAHMPMLEGFSIMPMLIAVRCGRWNDALATPKPADDRPISLAVWHFSRGMALAASGKSDEASEERDQFLAVKKKIPTTAPWSLNTAGEVLPIAQHLLEAKILEADKDTEAAIAILQRAVKEEGQLAYDEPPSWPIPIRESLGGALLKLNKYPEAEKVFREDLAKNPRSGRSLYGLMESLRAQGKKYEAEFIDLQYQQAWKNAERPMRRKDLW
jgi:tetratricopeptide (TPR) repeat protein